MKRVLSIILMLCIVFSMAACSGIKPELPTEPSTEPTEPTEPTVAPTEPVPPKPADIRQEAPFSKENVPEFLDMYYKRYPSLANNIYVVKESCYNDTPPGVYEETGVQIFTFQSAPESILLLGDTVHPVGTPFFSPVFFDWVISAVPYDYDGDGIKDLIMSYLNDTGASYRNIIQVFNPVSEKFTQLYRWDDPSADSTLYVVALENSSQAPFAVWRVKEDLDWEKNSGGDGVLVQKSYLFKQFEGYIKPVDGSLQFVPYEK